MHVTLYQPPLVIAQACLQWWTFYVTTITYNPPTECVNPLPLPPSISPSTLLNKTLAQLPIWCFMWTDWMALLSTLKPLTAQTISSHACYVQCWFAGSQSEYLPHPVSVLQDSSHSWRFRREGSTEKKESYNLSLLQYSRAFEGDNKVKGCKDIDGQDDM